METKNELVPFLATHPGLILQNELQERGIKQKDFAVQIGESRPHLNDLIKGRRDMTDELAIKLEDALGIPHSVWMNLQNKYNYDKIMISRRDEEERQYILREKFCNELVNLSYLYKLFSITSGTAKMRLTALKNILGFEITQMRVTDACVFGRFKHSEKSQIDERNLHTWLLLATIAGRDEQVSARYHNGNAVEAARRIAGMANDGTLSISEIKNCLNKYGIAYVKVDKLDKVPVDAFSTKINGKPVVVVTYRFNDIDKLAFDILHELCHIDKHIDDMNRSFVALDGSRYSEDAYEKEANKFAMDMLIPPDVWDKIMKSCNAKSAYPHAIAHSIALSAGKLGISKSIAISRYKHDENVYNISAYRSEKIK